MHVLIASKLIKSLLQNKKERKSRGCWLCRESMINIPSYCHVVFLSCSFKSQFSSRNFYIALHMNASNLCSLSTNVELFGYLASKQRTRTTFLSLTNILLLGPNGIMYMTMRIPTLTIAYPHKTDQLTLGRCNRHHLPL